MMGIIVRNLSSNCLSNVRLGKNHETVDYPYDVREYNNEWKIISPYIPSNVTTNSYTNEDNIITSVSHAWSTPNDYLRNMFNEDRAVGLWNSSNLGSSGYGAVSVIYPENITIQGFYLASEARPSGWTSSSANGTFRNASFQYFDGSIWHTYMTFSGVWAQYRKELVDVGNITASGFRVRMQGALAGSSNHHIAASKFLILVK